MTDARLPGSEREEEGEQCYQLMLYRRVFLLPVALLV